MSIPNLYKRLITHIYDNLTGFPKINVCDKIIEILPAFSITQNNKYVYYNIRTTEYLRLLKELGVNFIIEKDKEENIITIKILHTLEEYIAIIKLNGLR